jgi:hypothetical protein
MEMFSSCKLQNYSNRLNECSFICGYFQAFGEILVGIEQPTEAEKDKFL